MPQMFMDTIGADRNKRYIFCLSAEESKFLHDEAKKQGVHVSVLLRRVVRISLIEKPELFGLFK